MITFLTILILASLRKKYVSPSSSPLGTFRTEELVPPREKSPAAKSEQMRMFSQATFLPVTMMLVSQARRIACENSPHVRKSGARNRRNSC